MCIRDSFKEGGNTVGIGADVLLPELTGSVALILLGLLLLLLLLDANTGMNDVQGDILEVHGVDTLDTLGTKEVGVFLTEGLSLIHISEPTRLLSISYAVFCLKKKKYIITIMSSCFILAA
eukprot:TRINITY_DN54789_c0_g1_i1.p2 TRINITY_DN54789_c0_g1~~TRINITY_DN54789_c0_g1_i1.p2  ORF type:complete len:121 (+),score=24.73 TRINITY_DN54789_c0_g1_i1:141-503(+)